MKKLLSNLIVQLILCICVAVATANIMPEWLARLSFTVSYFIKEAFVFVLPLIIFSYVTSGLGAFKNQGLAILFATLGIVVVINFLACLFGYGVSFFALGFLPHLGTPCDLGSCPHELKPLWKLTLPSLIAPMQAMIAAFVVGIGNSYVGNVKLARIVEALKGGVEKGLKTILIPLLPLYVFGFLVKLTCDGQIGTLVAGFGPVFVLVLLSGVLYSGMLMLISARVTGNPISVMLKEMIPVVITGFSTMSSAATLPVSMEAVKKLIPHNKSFANFFLPTVANVALALDGIAITLMVCTILMMNTGTFMPIHQFGIYVVFYCLLKFSSAGIPGGGILILNSLFAKKLGMDATTISVLVTLYILMDPILTAGNVTANAISSTLVERIYNAFNLFGEKPSKK